MDTITARSWAGATLRSLSFDLDTRTLVLELYAREAARCDRIVVTNGDVEISGTLDTVGGRACCLVSEPLWSPDDGVGTLTFTTATFAVTVRGGLVSVDAYAVEDDAMPLWLTDMDALDGIGWPKAA